MAAQPISSANRICELNDINEVIAKMIKSAGLAVNALTDRPLEPTELTDSSVGEEDMSTRKAAFREHTAEYYTCLQAVVARLRRQAYALEEAKIIAPEAHIGGMGRPKAESTRLTNGGLGNLDVGYLNSRGNKVGVKKEAELIDEAAKFLQEHVAGGRD